MSASSHDCTAPAAGKGEGVVLSRATLICRRCQNTFRQYKGMKKMGTSNIGVCPSCLASKKDVPA
jgi:rubrerythrin